ncbi:MAG: hypothetical protein NVS4B1_11680 [Ktedonobacteraceae bacterium]
MRSIPAGIEPSTGKAPVTLLARISRRLTNALPLLLGVSLLLEFDVLYSLLNANISTTVYPEWHTLCLNYYTL